MADFCRQCTEEQGMPGGNYPGGDLDGLITEAEVKDGFGLNAICESCGPTLVDHEGYCLCRDCITPHKFYPAHAPPINKVD